MENKRNFLNGPSMYPNLKVNRGGYSNMPSGKPKSSAFQQKTTTDTTLKEKEDKGLIEKIKSRASDIYKKGKEKVKGVVESLENPDVKLGQRYGGGGKKWWQ